MSTATATIPGAEARRRFITADAAAFRGVADALGAEPGGEMLRVLAERYEPPRWVTGCVSFGDAWFLGEMIRCLRPERVVEVGVASGASSAVMLMALREVWRDLSDGGSRPRLESFDLMHRCYFDESRAVGAAVAEMAPELSGGDGWRLRTGTTAADAGRLLEGADLSLAFVDADHRHPWPAADVLALRPALRRGAWVVLHDIDLPEVARRYAAKHGTEANWGTAGVKMLFDAWPFEKIRGEGACHNIGAVRMPVDRELELSDLDGVLDEAWEAEPGPDVREDLDRPAAEDAQLRLAAERVLRRVGAGERVALFGMGNNAHAMLAVMRRMGGTGVLEWADDREWARPPRAASMELRRVSAAELDAGAVVVVTPNDSGAMVARLRARGVRTVLAAREMR